MQVKATGAGFDLGGKFLPAISGAVHYWRIERDKWGRVLDAVAELGFNVVETYVPWSVHELARGSFDFGERDPSKSLDEFIEACKARGLYLILRPGPHINAEITLFGYPERVLRDDKCLAVSVDGDKVWLPAPPKMFPVPSYASEAFLAEVGTWFDALAPRLKGRLASEGGNVVAIQIDNEFSNFFRNSAFDHDYHEDSIKLWREFMVQKHGSDAPTGDPPREFRASKKEDLPQYLDLVEFKEFYMQRALTRLKTMWEDRKITGVPFFHNYCCGHDVPPNNLAQIETTLDFQGADSYPTRKQYIGLKALACHLSGESRFPYIPEFSSGAFFWTSPVSARDQEFTTPVCFMHGVKGINFYMLVERERWYGSPITRDGNKREKHWALFEDFHRWMKRTKVYNLKKKADVLLLAQRDYQRLSIASTLLDPLPPLLPDLIPAEMHCADEDFGLGDVIQIDSENQWYAMFHGLSTAKVPFNCGNTSQSLQDLCKYKMVLCPSYAFMAAEVQKKLADYARQGGALVIGPRLPDLDEKMNPHDELKREFDKGMVFEDQTAVSVKVAKGSITFLKDPLPRASARKRPEGLEELFQTLAQRFGVARPYPAEDPAVETTLHEGEGRKILFVANPTKKARTASISLDGEKLVDVKTDRAYEPPIAQIEMEAYTVGIFEVV